VGILQLICIILTIKNYYFFKSSDNSKVELNKTMLAEHYYQSVYTGRVLTLMMINK